MPLNGEDELLGRLVYSFFVAAGAMLKASRLLSRFMLVDTRHGNARCD